MLPELVQDGYLPVGRYPASLDEVEMRFAFNEHRRLLMQEFKKLYDVLSQCIGTYPAFWMSGSFLTEKEDPSDIDVVFLLPWDLVQRLNTQGRKFITRIANSEVYDAWGLHIDSYVLTVASPPDTKMPSGNLPEYTYLLWRGYWDNLWSSTKAKDGVHLVPGTRGYLEVSPHVG